MSTATVPRATGYPVPASGADLNSEPVRTQIVNLVDFLEGGNIAQGNVDVTEVATLATANTWTANQSITATLTVGVDDTGYDVRFYGATTGKSFLWDESADQLTISGNISVSDGATLPTGTTVGNLTLADGSITDSSGNISFGNEDLTTTGTLSAGATTVTSLAVSSNDGGAIGASGTAFSDLFLASGGVVNFAAGDMTITHSSGALSIAGGTFNVGAVSVSAGSRIDFDADSDTSWRSSSDDTLVAEAGGQDIFTVSNTGDALCRFDSWSTTVNNTVIYGQPASGTAFTGLAFYQGSGDGSTNNMSYDMGYLGSGGYLRVRSADTDGSSTDADIIRIPDGQLTVDGNSTFDDNAFDYVCNDCGWHHADEHTECPECGGKVEWHDDVELMDLVVHTAHNSTTRTQGIERLEKLGLVNTYGTLHSDTPQMFTSMNKMPWFLMSGMAQLHKEVKELKTQIGVA